MTRRVMETPERARRREWHGYVFMGWLTAPQMIAVKHYIATGEKTPQYPPPKPKPQESRLTRPDRRNYGKEGG